MEVKILKRTPNELKIEVQGEGHTFCNVLQKVLLKDETIEMAGYDVPHPLFENPVIYVHTKGRRKPEAALREAAKKLKIQNKEFRESFNKALEVWQRK